MPYLLDTNIVSDLIRRPRGPVMRRIKQVGETQVCTSIIVAAEVRYGIAKKSMLTLETQLNAILTTLAILPFEAPADQVYGMLRARLERMGEPIGANDLLIASHALALGYTIVTDNEREFSKVDDLPRENWLHVS
jgi:tRNA(fMet)-specific endonuclease VapC